MRKTSALNPLKNLLYNKCYCSNSSRPIKSPRVPSDITVRRFAVERKDLKPYRKSEGHISRGNKQAYDQVFQRLYHRQKEDEQGIGS